MKANRKFTRSNDEAVSPVIAVILMVAITVVLAATVYVWVSGFGAQTSQPSMSVALTSTSAIASGKDSSSVGANDTLKTYTVSAATPGMKWSDVKVTLDGAQLAYDADFIANDTGYQVTSTSDGVAIDGTAIDTAFIKAGQLLKIHFDGDLDGKTLRLIDAQANSVILTVVVG